MEELTIRYQAIDAQLKALKFSLNDEQLSLFKDSLLESKTKVLESLKEHDSSLLKLIDELFQ